MKKNNKKINLGVIVYKNTSHRHASKNLGDYIQTISILNLYKKIVEKHNKRKRPYKIRTFVKHAIEGKVKNFNFVFLNRDNISDEEVHKNHENIITFFHGWWMHPGADGRAIDFNIPPNIKPIFLSFHIAKEALYKEENLEKLKKAEPIGCRDLTTLKNLKENKIKAYFSGCSTSTIDFFKWDEKSDASLGVDYPGTLSENLSHQNINYQNADHEQMLFKALDHLELYSKSKLVKTSRLHCYIPCMAMGVPVILASERSNEKYGRFKGFEQLKSESAEFKKMQKNINKKALEIIKLF